MIESVLRIAGLLVFVGTALSLLVLLAVGVHALVSGRRTRAAVTGAIALGLVGAYLVVLVGYAAASRERVLAKGEEKWLCALDCDLAYSIAFVHSGPTLPIGLRAAPGHRLWFVVLRVRSDAARVTFDVSDTRALVVDASGRRFAPRPDVEAALARASGGESMFSRPLPAGAQYTERLVFELPESVSNPRLLVTLGGWVTRFVPGDESAPFHRKTLLLLT